MKKHSYLEYEKEKFFVTKKWKVARLLLYLIIKSSYLKLTNHHLLLISAHEKSNTLIIGASFSRM